MDEYASQSLRHPSLGLASGTTVVRDYDDRWPGEFVHEAAALRSILGELVVEIEHIGSTAVPGLAAKPVNDMAISFRGSAGLAEAARRRGEAKRLRGPQGGAGGSLSLRPAPPYLNGKAEFILATITAHPSRSS